MLNFQHNSCCLRQLELILSKKFFSKRHITMFPRVLPFWIFFSFLCINSLFTWASVSVGIDSIGVQKVGDKSYILHEVETKETLFGISRRYASPVNDIIGANEVLKQGLKIGQTIRIPFTPQTELPVGSVLHKVGPGETLFSIAKNYGTTVEQIKQANKMQGNDLSVGQALLVDNGAMAQLQPVTSEIVARSQDVDKPLIAAPSAAGSASKTVETPKEERIKPAIENIEPSKSESKNVNLTALDYSTPIVPGEFISHQVQAGETLFSIANRYNIKMDELIALNALSSNNLRMGQVLKVGRGPAETSKVPVIGTPRVVSSVDEMNVEQITESTGGYKNIRETGQAERIEGTGGHKKYLVLHRNAPVGSIMRIKNEENDVTIFARVVGILPETGDNSKLVIKLSQAAFDQLKAVNSRFPVEILY